MLYLKQKIIISSHDKKIFDSFVEKNKWIFAKTYAKTYPHEYILRENCDEKDFEWMVKFIRVKGKPRKFFRRTYIYFFHEGYKYWTMGSPAVETVVINRVRL